MSNCPQETADLRENFYLAINTMGIDELLEFANELISESVGRPLSTLETQIFRGSWDKHTYEKIAEPTSYSVSHVKDEGAELWKRLSTVLEKQVTKTNFQVVLECECKQRSQACSTPITLFLTKPNTSQHAPVDQSFVGRGEAIANLDKLIASGRKLILIHQRGGEGKTTLAKQYLKQHFGDKVLEFLIAKEPNAVSSVEILLEEPLRKLGTEPGLELGASLNRLRQKLKLIKVGVLIDNLETILDGDGKIFEPYRSYLELLRILVDTDVRSTTLITSRSQLCESNLDIETYHLEILDIVAWQEYFRSQGLDIEKDYSTMKAMYKTHGGNALAMKLRCGRAMKDFEGDIDAYWKSARGDRLLKGEVRNDDSQLRNLIVEQFDYLANVDTVAYSLLIRMGCYRYQDDAPKTSEGGLFCLLWDVSEEEQGRIITSLRDRALIEFNFNKVRRDSEYWLHPEIKSEAISRLKKITDWEVAHQQAARFWHDEVEQIENTEDALRAFESYYHYMMIEDYEKAANELLFRRPNSVEETNKFEGGATLGGSLIKHSLFSQIESAAKQLVVKVTNKQYLSKLYSFLGCICRDRGEIGKAIKHFKTSQVLATEAIEDLNEIEKSSHSDKISILKELTADSLLNTANCKTKLGELKQALLICEQVEQMLEYEEDEYFLKRKIHAYFSLAYLHSFEASKEHKTQAEHKKKALNYAQKAYEENLSAILDKHIFGLRLALLGATYKNIGDLETATNFYSLLKDREDCPTVVKAEALYGLAEVCRKKQAFEQSKQFCKDAIKCLEEIGASFGLAEAYLQLGLTLKSQGLFTESEESIKKSIALFQDIGATKQIVRVNKIISGHVSCGVLVVKKSKTKTEILLLHRELTNSWHLPKGTYEPERDRNYRETAIREAFEETGFEVELLDDLGFLKSQYELHGERINKTTHYYLGKPLCQTGKPDDEHDGYQWVETNEAKKRLCLYLNHQLEYEAQIIETFEEIQKQKHLLL